MSEWLNQLEGTQPAVQAPRPPLWIVLLINPATLGFLFVWLGYN